MPGLASYTLSPDDRTAAFTADVKGAPALFVSDSDGRSIHRLEIGSFPFGASFDPTGTRILFVGAQGVDWSYSGLYRVDVDGSNLTTLVQPTMYAPMEGPARWSPDGSLIAYGRWETNVTRAVARPRIAADGTTIVSSVISRVFGTRRCMAGRLTDGASASSGVPRRKLVGPAWEPSSSPSMASRRIHGPVPDEGRLA
jgi:Tol biopolymer transport system component